MLEAKAQRILQSAPRRTISIARYSDGDKTKEKRNFFQTIVFNIRVNFDNT